MSTNVPKNFATIKRLIETGGITRFGEIFDHIKPTPVYRAMGMNYRRFKRIQDKPPLYELGELLQLAKVFKVDEKVLIDLAYKQILVDRELAKKGKSTVTKKK